MPNKLITILLFALSSTFGLADICDDINGLADGWNDVSNFVNECEEDEEFTDDELETLEKYVTDLAEGTYGLADALIDVGNQKETRLGTNMRKTMSKLAKADDLDKTVELLDKLVDILDKTVDYCDE